MYLYFVNFVFFVNIKNILKQFIVSLLKAKNPRKHEKNQKTYDCTTPKIQSNQSIFFDEAVALFEDKCESLSHSCCQSCHIIGISMCHHTRINLYVQAVKHLIQIMKI